MVVDIDAFNALQKSKGWNDAEAARRMEIQQSTITRIRDGGSAGSLFIDGALTVFEVPYKELFSRKRLVKA